MERDKWFSLLTNPVPKHRVCQIILSMNPKQKEMRGVRAAFRTNKGNFALCGGRLRTLSQDPTPFWKRSIKTFVHFDSDKPLSAVWLTCSCKWVSRLQHRCSWVFSRSFRWCCVGDLCIYFTSYFWNINWIWFYFSCFANISINYFYLLFLLLHPLKH